MVIIGQIKQSNFHGKQQPQWLKYSLHKTRNNKKLRTQFLEANLAQMYDIGRQSLDSSKSALDKFKHSISCMWNFSLGGIQISSEKLVTFWPNLKFLGWNIAKLLRPASAIPESASILLRPKLEPHNTKTSTTCADTARHCRTLLHHNSTKYYLAKICPKQRNWATKKRLVSLEPPHLKPFDENPS